MHDYPPSSTFIVTLTQGLSAVVDLADRSLVESYRWHVAGKGDYRYAYARHADRKVAAMHRVIAGAGPGQLVDHIDGDRLNNRRSNLRIANAATNSWNTRKPRRLNRTSQFKGVSLHRSVNKWSATIEQNGARLYIGTFETEEQAARAYDAAAKVFHGAFARTNAMMGLL